MADSDNPSLLLRIRQHQRLVIDDFRHRLAYIDALPQLTLLGLISGIFSGLVIVAFRWLIDTPLAYLLPGGGENFESLAPLWRFVLPFAGACCLGFFLHRLARQHRAVGVGHVLDRLHNHQGRMPARNWLVQFAGGIISLISGQSVGREGPAIHLGAGAASQLGQWLKLPNNSLRTLVGCGVAAAIAASFNTPMAGVIFAMEVILMEYTIAGFIPVILASVSGAALTQLVFDQGIAFDTAGEQMNSLWELPYIAASGLVIAACAAAFIRLHLSMQKIRITSIRARLALAGLLTGGVAVFVPQIMGAGYDTVAAAMLGEMGLALLATIIVAKLLVTAISTGLGVIGGVIGPTLVIGACLGSCLGILGSALITGDASAASIYVLLGMAGMMAAVLNAPLAALMAVLELTYNPNMIFPTMLMIVVACLATRQLFGCKGLFLASLSAGGTRLQEGPMYQVLSRAGVSSVMDTRFRCSRQCLSPGQARALLRSQPMWIVIEEPEQPKTLLRAADLATYLTYLDTHAYDTYLDTHDAYLDTHAKDAHASAYLDTHADGVDGEPAPDRDIDLLAIPGRRHQPLPIGQQANLYEALKMLQQGAEALCVESDTVPPTAVKTAPAAMGPAVTGIVTRGTIDNYYRI